MPEIANFLPSRSLWQVEDFHQMLTAVCQSNTNAKPYDEGLQDEECGNRLNTYLLEELLLSIAQAITFLREFKVILEATLTAIGHRTLETTRAPSI
jgi:hypothetical protein